MQHQRFKPTPKQSSEQLASICLFINENKHAFAFVYILLNNSEQSWELLIFFQYFDSLVYVLASLASVAHYDFNRRL